MTEEDMELLVLPFYNFQHLDKDNKIKNRIEQTNERKNRLFPNVIDIVSILIIAPVLLGCPHQSMFLPPLS
jgi:hypothetical protein